MSTDFTAPEPLVYLNGQLLPLSQARIDPTDRGLLLGDGLFETMRAEAGRIFRLGAHLARLRSGAGVLRLPLSLSDDELSAALQMTLAANELTTSSAALRLTLTRGLGPRGLLPPTDPRPTLLMTTSQLPDSPLAPATAHIASIRRNEHSPLSNLKSLNYLDNLLARQEAAAHGADEALLLNTAGHLAEASSANLFVVMGGVLRTPPLADGVLPGITRAVVLELAAEMGQPAVEASLTPADLARAEEAFLTNSMIGVRALVRVGEQRVGRGEAGSITQQLETRYRALTRPDLP